MPAPPAAAVTVQAVEGLVKQSPGFRSLWMSWHRTTRRHWRTTRLSGERLGSWGWEPAKLREDSNSFRQTLQRMVERVNPSGNGDPYCEQQLLTPAQEHFSLLCLSPSPSPCKHCPVALLHGVQSHNFHLTCHDHQTGSPIIPLQPRSTTNVLPDIVLQTVDPVVEY